MNWAEANQQYLIASMALAREAFSGESEGRGEPEGRATAIDAIESARRNLPHPATIDTLTEIFELSAFERMLLLLAAAAELDPSGAALHLTFGLAAAKLDGPHWTAFTPSGPLRHWRMIRSEPGVDVMSSRIRIDERILHYLAGAPGMDDRLRPYLQPMEAPTALFNAQQSLTEKIAGHWRQGQQRPQPVVLCGSDPLHRRAVAASAGMQSGLTVWAMDAELLPAAPAEFQELLTLWDREAALSNAVLLLECDRAVHENLILRWMEGTRNELIVSSDVRRVSHLRPSLIVDMPRPAWAEQWNLWQSGGGPRLEARPKLEHLAQRIEPAAGWEDLVLPGPQQDTLRDIAMHVRQRAKVYDEWGFAGKSSRGLGIGVLFSGPSGTGKTMAAEVLARELNLDLYRVDLSQVVSKYIGETEKNLRKVFDAAEHGGAILLFDEADALFGKRSEVKDSHDRYANVEISYLLQRMEAYRGLAILTTNMKSSLDQAFQRRIRFVVDFPFPDAAMRAEIWRRVFPAATPRNGIDTTALARMNIAGGNIRNIALNAAFRAADLGEPVHMSHILEAARAEYLKMERPFGEITMGAMK